jgi:2-haloacid dehalogenase
MNARPTVLVFDVNETLLDVRALTPAFSSAFGDAALLPAWFGLLLRYSLEVTVTGDYRPFDELAMDALLTAAAQADRQVSAPDAAAIIEAMAELPAHPDVAPALERLNAAGYRLVTLTNSRLEIVERQLRFAGIGDAFDTLLSIEDVERFKPAPETYALAAERTGTAIGDIMLVAAHDWDVNGALLAGAQAAFVEREGVTRARHDRIPSLSASDLAVIADLLTDAESPR